MNNRPNGNRLRVNGFLKHLATQTGVEIALDESGRCTMEFEEGLSVTLTVPKEGGNFFLQAGLIEAPRDISFPLLEEALRLNLRFADTRGSSIGLDDLGEVLVLQYWYPLEACDETLFANILANFIATAYELNARLMQVVKNAFGGKRIPSPADELIQAV